MALIGSLSPKSNAASSKVTGGTYRLEKPEALPRRNQNINKIVATNSTTTM